MRDPLFRMIPRGQAAIMDDIPVAFSFTSDGLTRQEAPRIPPRVIREALVNALMHRSYLIHGPVEVVRFANRLEIRNPGHSLKPVENLGEPGSKTRNPNIASVLHETNYAETKGSGVRVMQQLMESANLSPPTFESDREHDQFTATFLMHHFLDKQDIAWLAHFKDANLSDDEARILIHARENGWVNNGICRYYTKLDTLGASGILRRLRDLGLLQQHPHASMTYYTPTPKLLHPDVTEKKTSEQKIPAHEKKTTLTDFAPAMPGTSQPANLPTMPGSLPTNLRALPTNLPPLPTNLLEEIRNLGQRSPPGHVQKIIAELCAIRAFTADELAGTLNRNKQWVFRSYLSPMIRDGILEYTMPENPHHPNQAYRAKKRKEHP
jgi:ATP-dependent DNA helicase RecG